MPRGRQTASIEVPFQHFGNFDGRSSGFLSFVKNRNETYG